MSAAPSVAVPDWRTWLQHEVARTSDAGHRLTFTSPWTPLHLWYRPSDPASAGELVIAEQAPSSAFALASDQPIQCNWTREQIHGFVHETARKLPILPPH